MVYTVLKVISISDGKKMLLEYSRFIQETCWKLCSLTSRLTCHHLQYGDTSLAVMCPPP